MQAKTGSIDQTGLMPAKLQDGRLLVVDQRQLPFNFEYFDATDFDQLIYAIKEMVVRGAPAIGFVAAYGLAILAQQLKAAGHSPKTFARLFDAHSQRLANARPTAVNLQFAVAKVQSKVLSGLPDLTAACALGLAEAERLEQELILANFKLSQNGLSLIKQGDTIITHCNAGPLAACGHGTALGVIRMAHFTGLDIKVLVDETRPRNQGARLTMYELMRDQVPCQLIADNMSGFFMAQGKVDLVITGADRIALNGDTANKIGTYNLAVLAHHHGIPFYIAAPLSTFDFDLKDGSGIPIEFRSPEELTTINNQPHSCPEAQALNPAFDVTPASLIAGVVTEAGVLKPPYDFAYLKSMYSMA